MDQFPSIVRTRLQEHFSHDKYGLWIIAYYVLEKLNSIYIEGYMWKSVNNYNKRKFLNTKSTSYLLLLSVEQRFSNCFLVDHLQDVIGVSGPLAATVLPYYQNSSKM